MVIEKKQTCDSNSRGIFDEELKIMYRYVVIPGKLEANGSIWASQGQ